MARSRITRNGQRDLADRKLARNRAALHHVIMTCHIHFESGKYVNKARAIAGLRKLATHVDRSELVLNKNLYPTHTKRVSEGIKTPNVFMGFDSAPLHALPEWLEFQPKHDGQNAPVIDDMFHQSSAGVLTFATEKRDSQFVHMHEISQRRTVICTSQVCFQEYLTKESDKKQRQKPNSGANNKKRKCDTHNQETSERKRIKCHQKTFRAVCEAWKRDYGARMQLPNLPVNFQYLPLDLKLMIWDFAMPPRAVIINPVVVSELYGKTLYIKTNNLSSPLFSVNRQSRYTLLESNSTIRLADSNGPSGLIFDGNKDTVVLLGLKFLRTPSLLNFAKIVQPFSKIKKLAIPWTSTGWSAAHVAFMPFRFESLKTLTLLGCNDDISNITKHGYQWETSEATDDFQYHSEAIQRGQWVQDAYEKRGYNIEVQLLIVEIPPKEEEKAKLSNVSQPLAKKK